MSALLLVGFGATVGAGAATKPAVMPASDPENKGGWVLNDSVSDEFEGTKLDGSKWFVEGENGDYYIWKGRAPSQFAPHNVIVENGLLKLRTQWEPDFAFANENYADGKEDAKYGEYQGKPMPVTTAAIISRKRFLNGYMEVRSKAGNASMTSSFWMIGYESELDVYEQIGNPKIKGDIQADTLKSSVHDWRAGSTRPNRRFGSKTTLPFRAADEFHVYGCEWGEDYLKCFLDGKLVYAVTQQEVGKDWMITNPFEIWLDSEIFAWLGMPHKEELPADYEVDYVRVWQKPSANLLARQFFGFEGPILFEQNPRPLKLVPESSVEDDYQKFWRIDAASAKQLSIVAHEKFTSGLKSLKFTPSGSGATEVVAAVAPEGSVNLPQGEYVFSAKIWIETNSTAQRILFSLADPAIDLPVDLQTCAKGEWVTVTRSFTRNKASTAKDSLTIAIQQTAATAANGAVYIDDISIASPAGSATKKQPGAAKPATTPPSVPAWLQNQVDLVTAAIPDLSTAQKLQLTDAIKVRVEALAKVKALKEGGATDEKIKIQTMEVWSSYTRKVKTFLTEEQFEKFKELQKPKKTGPTK